MVERLRAFLREIGPGGVRSSLAIFLAALVLLILSLAAIRLGLVGLGHEEVERDTGRALEGCG
jgi:hypothetical protein